MGATKDQRGGRAGREPSLQDTYKVIQQRLRSAIRQVWSRYSPERREVLYRAKRTKRKTNKNGEVSKVPDIRYICALCKGEFKATQIQIDHIKPVGKTPPFPGKGWDEWLTKVFCKIENLQVLCKPCHVEKTRKDKK